MSLSSRLARRVTFPSMLAVLAVLGATAILVTSVHAAAPPNAVYKGTFSNADTISLTADAAGEKLTLSVVRSGLEGCVGTTTLVTLPLSQSNTFFNGSSAVTGAPGIISRWYTGALADGGAMIGTPDYFYEASATNSSCTTHTTYLAEATEGAGVGPGIPARSVWRGSVSSGANLGTGGTIEISTGDSPDVIDKLKIDYKEGACAYTVEMENITLTSGKMFHVGLRTTQRPAPAPSVAGVTQTSDVIEGVFSAPAKSGCPGVTGVWFARIVRAQSAAPAARPSTAPASQVRGPGTVSSRVPATGTGLTIFAGGTNDQLTGAAGCASLASAGFWVSDGSGGFVTYVPGATITVVNAAWNSKFTTGIPANTVVIGRCS